MLKLLVPRLSPRCQSHLIPGTYSASFPPAHFAPSRDANYVHVVTLIKTRRFFCPGMPPFTRGCPLFFQRKANCTHLQLLGPDQDRRATGSTPRSQTAHPTPLQTHGAAPHQCRYRTSRPTPIPANWAYKQLLQAPPQPPSPWPAVLRATTHDKGRPRQLGCASQALNPWDSPRGGPLA